MSDEYMERARAALDGFKPQRTFMNPGWKEELAPHVARALREAELEANAPKTGMEYLVRTEPPVPLLEALSRAESRLHDECARAKRAEAALRDAKDAAGLPAGASQADFCNAVREAAAKVAVLERRVRELDVRCEKWRSDSIEGYRQRDAALERAEKAEARVAELESPQHVVPRAELTLALAQLREAERERDEARAEVACLLNTPSDHHDEYRATLQKMADATRRADHTQFQRISGILMDAGDVPVDWDDLAAGVSFVVEQRDQAYRVHKHQVARLDAALALLREVQYEGSSEPGWKCVVCDYASPGHTAPTGHAPDCRLAALLEEKP